MMRRGHTGIGGWRNENPRHFKSRSSNNPHFRSSRNYRLLDSPRFAPPISRSLRPPYHPHSENQDQNISENAERNRYRINRHNRYNDHHEPYQKPHQQGDRQMLPLLQQSRFSNDHRNTFSDSASNHQFYDDNSIHINSMGDVDHRHFNTHGRESYRHPPFSNPWAPETHMPQPNERPHNKPHSLDRESSGEIHKASASYTGHRPPASDHYGCNPTHSFSTTDNSRTFSRSVDDTVDIVRRRLQNRSEPQNTSETSDDNQSSTNVDSQRLLETGDCLSNSQQETPAKKRYKQKHIAKSNCAKIKNKIVHQLFKMDKEKIHKLMDNPNSSHKFEYAISSLITESQNSFNRHLRSAAEKSLSSTSAEFMENDNNTIYEDTFLKQMQCILDPQDTVFLEDIKPIVMAELTKVLQIDEFDQKLSVSEDDTSYTNQDEPHSYNKYTKHKQSSYEEYPQSRILSQDLSHTQNTRRKSSDGVSSNYISYENSELSYDESNKPYFYRRPRSKSYNYNAEVSTSSENDFYRPVKNEVTENVNKTSTQQQYFDINTEQIPEEDDPFAELDQQYHVAVDHDFIESDDIGIPHQSNIGNTTSNVTNKDLKLEPQSPDKNSRIMVDIIDSQLQDTAKSPVKSYVTTESTTSPTEKSKNHLQIKQGISNRSAMLVQDKDINSVHEDTKEKSDWEPRDISRKNENDNPTTAFKSATTTNSRKRSVEQRPSHRKEKRKKIESSQSESSKQNCASKTLEKCEAPKSMLNDFFHREENKNVCKDNKKITSNDKSFTEKHVKRKETPKKAADTKKRKDSTSSQPTSPIDNNYNITNQTPTKSDPKTTLKTIDMFTEQPRKVSIHHAHRNTAPTPSATLTPKTSLDKTNKVKTPFSRHVVKRHVAVQVSRKCPTKETQTDKKKLIHKAIQTDLLVSDKPGRKSSDAFERMKEIDLEIQVLLQEKFKLYNSIESKESSVNSMQTLGMTVLNVDTFEEENEIAEDTLTEDTIVDDFANIPVEELEKIALETVSQDEMSESPTTQKRGRRRKISRNDSVKSGSPASIGRRKSKKAKSPNISLIEQIITDDRPLEDIISLDDLEVPQTKTKAKNQKKQVGRKKAPYKSSVEKSTPNANIELKDCSVVLLRLNHDDLLKHTHCIEFERNDNQIIAEHKMEECNNINTVEISEHSLRTNEVAFVEEVVNDLHLDMLDVSEDIVVGDCEVKSIEDKVVVESVPVPISEEIILDNSQSSMEEALPTVSQSEECKVYDYSADENLRRDSFVVSGNADAVLAIECVETNFLAACVDGNVYYFSNEGQLITTLRGSNLAVTCLTIVKEKHGTTVYTGSLDSRIRYYDLETGLEKGPECNVLSPIQTMDRAWDTVFVGTRTGYVLQFECKNNMLIPVSSVQFSDQNILALRAMKEGPRKVLLVAARSENVTIKDAQTGLLLRTLAGPKMTVYTLLYEDGKVYCGTSSHQIHVFDYTSGTHVGSHEGGKGAVCLRASGGLLFAGCYDGCVYVYKEGEGQPFAQIRGPSLMLLSLAVVGSKIIAGYKDRSLYIWKIPLCILQEMIL